MSRDRSSEELKRVLGAQRTLGSFKPKPDPEIYLNEKANRYMEMGTNKFVKTPSWGLLKKKKKLKRSKPLRKFSAIKKDSAPR